MERTTADMADLEVKKDSSTLAPTPFGKPMREHFLFDKDYINLNHGSFGTYPIPIRTRFHALQGLAESAPDKFMRYTGPSLLQTSRAAISSLLSVPPSTIVFLQNATLGVNTILRNIVYKSGDCIIYFDTIYAGCEKTIISILERTPGLTARRVTDYKLPSTHATILAAFHSTLASVRSEGLNPKLAVFDTIVAVPGVRFPFEQLTLACKEEGLLSVVDGAHGIGQIPFPLGDKGGWDPDFLVSNLHKWLFVPRGCAALYVPVRNHHLMRTAFPTSHGFVPLKAPAGETDQTEPEDKIIGPGGETRFTRLFAWVATMDTTPYYTVPEALAFRKDIGGGEEKVIGYLWDLARKGGDLVAERLGTEVMDDGVESGKGGIRDCAFANVRLPISVNIMPTGDDPESQTTSQDEKGIHVSNLQGVITYAQRTITEDFNTFIPLYAYKDTLWVRLSSQIYLDIEDFKFAARVLREICDRVGEGKWRR